MRKVMMEEFVSFAAILIVLNKITSIDSFSMFPDSSRNIIGRDVVNFLEKSSNKFLEAPCSELGPLSMKIEELGENLCGIGRAKAAWDCYRIGLDPLDYYCADIDIKDNVNVILPSKRKTEGMGKHALQRLNELSGRLEDSVAKISHIKSSSDGTTKLLCKLLKDGLEVECVIIPWFDRGSSTLCISSQVGCRQGCTFCATGRMGLFRSLSSDEILCQVYLAHKILRLSTTTLPPIDNIVFMGMGEPADNIPNVIRAAQVLTDRNCFQMAQTKVTISTVSPSPQSFLDMAHAPCALAWSVHAVDDKKRKMLVPTTKFSMDELQRGFILALCKRPKRLRTVMLEIALIHNMNDSMKDADLLAKFAKQIVQSVQHCKLVVNLIPWNDIGHPKFKKPSNQAVFAFQKRLIHHQVYTFIRMTRGDDSDAACGQLATRRSTKVLV